MSTLEKAIELAARHHAGQVDKGGIPYILHPLAVMMAVEGERAKIVAVLHDVLEDTALTEADLRGAGFAPDIVDAMLALTKQPGESRMDSARRLVANPLAREVKLADIRQNMNLSRIPHPSAKDYARLAEYREVEAFLASS